MVLASEYLEENYPKYGVCVQTSNEDEKAVNNFGKKRNEITKLDISNKELEGNLVIEDWPNLEEINCSQNSLSNLSFNNLPKIVVVDAYNSKINNLSITNCPQLKCLSIWGNNYFNDLSFLDNLDPNNLKLLSMKGREHKYSPYDLAIFSKFINLNQLYIEGNNLCGLFKSLKNLTKLEILGTNIVSGLEFLPNNLKLIYSNDEEIGRILGKELRIQYGAKCYDYEFWQETNRKFLNSIVELNTIKKHIRNYFNPQQKDFLSQQIQLTQAQQSLKYANFVKYSSSVLAVLNGLIGNYYSSEKAYLGGAIGISGFVASYLASERYKVHVESIQKRWGDTEWVREETVDKFIQASAELEKNYRKLIELHRELSLINPRPTTSESVNQAFSEFLNSFANCREKIEKTNLTNQENKERKEGVEVKFNQIFAENWKETETTLNKLQTEIEIYQQTFLQANQEHQTQIEILPK